ncbi:MAG: TIGR02281 family clan AA aspartic protease [Deltaproteobacteria bacterium]
MTDVDLGSVIYLGAILIFVGSYVLVAGRSRVPQLIKHAVSWVLIFFVVFAGFGLWEQMKVEQVAGPSKPKLLQMNNAGEVEIPRSYDGHYYVTLMMNNTPVEFVVDTGASQIVLTQADAQRIGIDLQSLRFNGTAYSANGTVATANARIATVTMGPFTDRNVAVSVNGGEMQGSLLGMSYLNRFSKVSIEGKKLLLSRN